MPIPSVRRADTTFSGNVHAPVSPARWRVDGAVTGLIPMWWWGEPGPSTSSTTLLFHIGGLAKVLVPPLLDTPFLIVPRMTDHIAFNCLYPPQHVSMQQINAIPPSDLVPPFDDHVIPLYSFSEANFPTIQAITLHGFAKINCLQETEKFAVLGHLKYW